MNLNDFFESIERKTNRLVEERGLAAIPHREVVNKILQFCQIRCSILKNGQTVKFTVPYQIVKSIDIVEKLNIEVTITDATEDNSANGSGRVFLKEPIGWEKNKFKEATIIINAFSYNGILYERTILSSLYHELNHLYDFWNDYKNNCDLKRTVKTIKKTGKSISCQVTNNTQINQIISEIVYRLFSETELNALIANTYGDLQGINSKRKMFQEDVAKTKAYVIYRGIKIKLNDIKKEITNTPNGVDNLRTYLRSCTIFLNPYSNSDADYLKEFFRKVAFLLKRLYKGIGRVSSLYYDTDEFEYPKPTIISTAPETENVNFK